MADAPAGDATHRLVAAMRRSIELLLDTDPPNAGLIAAAEAMERLTEHLEQLPRRPARLPGQRRLRFGEPAVSGDPGALFETSAISGARNAIAPPLRFWAEGGVVHGAGVFGRAYEGPPGHVHGGFIAAAFDELLGLAQSTSGRAGMTGTLHVRYRRPTPLRRELRFEARLDKVEGKKLLTSGELYAGDTLCAEAEGLFVAVDFEQRFGGANPTVL